MIKLILTVMVIFVLVVFGSPATFACPVDDPDCEQEQEQSQTQQQSITLETTSPTTQQHAPALDNEYLTSHWEGRAEVVTRMFQHLADADEVVCYKYDSWFMDKINFHEVHKVFYKRWAEVKQLWPDSNIKYIIVRHPRNVASGISLSGVYSAAQPSHAGSAGPMVGFTSVGERDQFEIYFLKMKEDGSEAY